jgi:transposase
MRHLGLDVHQTRTQVCVIDDETGEVLGPDCVLTAELADWCAAQAPVAAVVVESGGLSWFVALQLQSLGLPVLVVDARKAHGHLALRATAKTDGHDARGLAWLSVKGLAAELQVWLPDAATLELRCWTRLREDLAGDRTRVINRLRGALRGLGLVCPATSMSGAQARRWYDQVSAALPAVVTAALASYWAHLSYLDTQLVQVDAQLAALAAERPACAVLQSLPGCATVLATALAAEIGAPGRFPSAGHLRSYAGLTPRVSQSGERRRTGPLDKRGNPHLRRALVLLAQQVARATAWRDTRLGRRYRRLRHRLGANPARLDLARQLADLIYELLSRGQALELSRLAA